MMEFLKNVGMGLAVLGAIVAIMAGIEVLASVAPNLVGGFALAALVICLAFILGAIIRDY